MSRQARIFIYLFIFFILEATVLNNFKLFGVKPDLLLISVVVFGLFLPAFWVIVFSCFCGLLLDIFYSGPFGVNIVMFCILGLLSRKLAKNLYIENDNVVIAVVFAASLLLSFIRRFMVPNVSSWLALRFCIQEALYTAFFSPFVFRVLSVFSH